MFKQSIMSFLLAGTMGDLIAPTCGCFLTFPKGKGEKFTFIIDTGKTLHTDETWHFLQGILQCCAQLEILSLAFGCGSNLKDYCNFLGSFFHFYIYFLFTIPQNDSPMRAALFTFPSRINLTNFSCNGWVILKSSVSLYMSL